jgi:oligoribonuclease
MIEAQQKLLEFLSTYCFEKTAPLCGSSIWVDRVFLKKDMPAVTDFLHYRNVDVASVKELVQRWYIFDLDKDLPKKDLHRALSDVYESINEMKYYRDNFFIPANKQ